jgi:hypothetical protein
MSGRAAGSLPVLVAATMAAGCTTVAYNGAGIQTTAEAARRAGGTHASFAVEGLRIEVRSGDVAREGEPVPPLSLLLVFDPPEIGYSFDPGQVDLRAEDGTAHRPRVRGPGLLGSYECRVTLPAADAPPGYHLLSPHTCFELAFDLAVAPGSRADLVLGGLALGSRRLDSPTLHLSRRHWRQIEHVWPLEILAVLLSGA